MTENRAAEDRLAAYKRGAEPLPQKNVLWPLYGAGFANLGREGGAIETPMPSFGPDELLVRHDAVGLCFSDVKVIRQGPAHPRIHLDMQTQPVVLGHEVSLTVVGVGEHLAGRFAVGDRFIVQADIHVHGIGRAYGYDIQGGLSRYSVADQRVLNGDDGCYLIPIPPAVGYAESALVEPWACVDAAYHIPYRAQWKDDGAVWLVGDGAGAHLGRLDGWRPRRLALDLRDAPLAAEARAWAAAAGVEVTADNGTDAYDDIVVLSADADLIERSLSRLNSQGMLALVTDERVARGIQIDVGRLHYDRITVVGSVGPAIASAYTPIRNHLLPAGAVWFLGAAGPMGYMHVQRALQMPQKPRRIVATNRRSERILEIERAFGATSRELGIDLVCLSHEALGEGRLAEHLRAATGGAGFDDIVALAPSAPAIELAAGHLADGGVLNVFAGLPRGAMATLDLNGVVRRGLRFIGSSASSIDDMRRMRDLMIDGVLTPNRSVAAISGLEGAADGLQAVAEGRCAGKIVVFPNVGAMPLTPLADLAGRYPSVAARLEGGAHWTAEAEDEFLRVALLRPS